MPEKKARVLNDCAIAGKQYAANDVDTFDGDTLTAYADRLDPSDAAVAYAESLKASPADEA